MTALIVLTTFCSPFDTFDLIAAEKPQLVSIVTKAVLINALPYLLFSTAWIFVLIALKSGETSDD